MNSPLKAIPSTLNINDEFSQFIDNEVLPLTEVSPSQFWSGLESIVANFSPRNQALIEKRETLQKSIDQWHKKNDYKDTDHAEYERFLRAIGYIVEEGDDFSIETKNVDDEVATIEECTFCA